MNNRLLIERLNKHTYLLEQNNKIKGLFNKLNKTSLRFKGSEWQRKVIPEHIKNFVNRLVGDNKRFDLKVDFESKEKPKSSYSIIWSKKNPDKLELFKIINSRWDKRFIDVDSSIEEIEKALNDF